MCGIGHGAAVEVVGGDGRWGGVGEGAAGKEQHMLLPDSDGVKCSSRERERENVVPASKTFVRAEAFGRETLPELKQAGQIN